VSCPCGYADECDGEHAIHYPLQDGGMCSVEKCKKPHDAPDPIPQYYTDRAQGAHAAKSPP
jgi:hypothetical protein